MLTTKCHSKLDEIIALAQEQGYFSFDVEHDPSLRPHDPNFELWGCSFCVGDQVEYITDNELIRETFVSLVKLGCIPVAHNAKYDLQCMSAIGVIPEDMPTTCCCTLVGVNLLDETRDYNKLGLKLLVWEKYKYKMMTYEEASAFGEGSPEFYKYATDDALYTWKLWCSVKPKLEEQGLFKLFSKILGPASLLLADMEYRGIYWDLPEAYKQAKKLEDVRERAEKEAREWLGEDINLNSPKQLAKRIFEDLKTSTKGIRKTDSGQYSTDEKSLIVLSNRVPQARALRALRTAVKQLNSYVEPNCISAEKSPDSRLHAKFWLSSSTGRTRSTDPALQTFTARWSKTIKKWFEGISIRACIRAPKGKKLICVDYSQIELRLMAHITKDARLLNAYRSWVCKKCGERGSCKVLLRECPRCGCPENEEIGFYHGLDLHSQTAEAIPALEGDRDAGKTANFSIIYRASEYTLWSRWPKITVKAWREAIEGWFDLYKDVYRWHNICEAMMVAGKPSKGLFGRLRRFSRKDLAKSYNHCLNQYVNSPAQGSATDLMLLCAGRLRKLAIEKGWWIDRMLVVNLVHDELLVECDEEIAEEVAQMVQVTLENSVKFLVPIRADYKIVDSWDKGK